MYDRSGSYTTDKPPYCEMILRAVSDSTPPDLTVSLTLTGGKLLEPITLERKAEHPSPPSPPPPPPPKINLLQAATSQGSESHPIPKDTHVTCQYSDDYDDLTTHTLIDSYRITKSGIVQVHASITLPVSIGNIMLDKCIVVILIFAF